MADFLCCLVNDCLIIGFNSTLINAKIFTQVHISAHESVTVTCYCS